VVQEGIKVVIAWYTNMRPRTVFHDAHELGSAVRGTGSTSCSACTAGAAGSRNMQVGRREAWRRISAPPPCRRFPLPTVRRGLRSISRSTRLRGSGGSLPKCRNLVQTRKRVRLPRSRLAAPAAPAPKRESTPDAATGMQSRSPSRLHGSREPGSALDGTPARLS
jgi:hypothetical protein